MLIIILDCRVIACPPQVDDAGEISHAASHKVVTSYSIRKEKTITVFTSLMTMYQYRANIYINYI